MPQYRVIRCVSYEPPEQPGLKQRWEPGDIIDTEAVVQGIPPLNIDWLLDDGAIEPV